MRPADLRPPATLDWRDPAPLLALLPVPPDQADVLVCGGAGEIALSLLAAGARSVTLLTDPASRAAAALKIAALQRLPPQSVRSFVGLGYFGRRIWFYHFLRDALPPGARQFWDAREELLRLGMLNAGSMEHHMARWRALAARLIGADSLSAPLSAAAPGLRLRALLRLPLPGAPPLLGHMLACLPARPPAGPPHFLLPWLLLGAWPDPDSPISSAPLWLTDAGHRALQPLLPRLHLPDSPPDTPFHAADLGISPDPAQIAAIRRLAPGAPLIGWWPGPALGAPDRRGPPSSVWFAHPRRCDD